MFTFAYRFGLRLLLVVSLLVVGFAGVIRVAEAAYPPILFSETSTLSLYTMTIGCASFWTTCGRSERVLVDGMYSLPVATWSPDGRYIAVHLLDDWKIYPTDCLLVLQTCEPVRVQAAAQDTRVAWGPDGTTLASYASTNTVSVTIQTNGCWQGNNPCFSKQIELSDYYALVESAWSGDGSRMAFSDYVQTGLVWLDTACFDKPEGCNNDLHTVSVGANRVSWPSLSYDGHLAVLMMDTKGDGTSRQLFWVNLDTGESRQLTDRPGQAEFPDWSVDGRYVLFSGFATLHGADLQIYLMDMARNITLPLITQSGRDLAFPSWGYLPH